MQVACAALPPSFRKGYSGRASSQYKVFNVEATSGRESPVSANSQEDYSPGGFKERSMDFLWNEAAYSQEQFPRVFWDTVPSSELAMDEVRISGTWWG